MKRHTSNEWLEFFGYEMVDDDGWRAQGQSSEGPEQFTLTEFVDRLYSSTVSINLSSMFKDRRAVLNFIS